MKKFLKTFCHTLQAIGVGVGAGVLANPDVIAALPPGAKTKLLAGAAIFNACMPSLQSALKKKGLKEE